MNDICVKNSGKTLRSGYDSALFEILASTYGPDSWTINNLEGYSKSNMLQEWQEH